MSTTGVCLIAILALIVFALIFKVILKIALWIILIIILFIIVGGGIAYFMKILGGVIFPLTGAFLV